MDTPRPKPVQPSWWFERPDDGWYDDWKPDEAQDEKSRRYGEEHSRRRDDEVEW